MLSTSRTGTQAEHHLEWALVRLQSGGGPPAGSDHRPVDLDRDRPRIGPSGTAVTLLGFVRLSRTF